MNRACDICGTTYTAKRVSSRYCSERCKKRAQRGTQPGKPSVQPENRQQPAMVALPQPEPALSGELTSSTEQTLRDAARLDTWQGRAALAIAQRIEAAGVDSGSSYAALHRELRSAMETALRGVGEQVSAVQRRRDELAARRARKTA
jgi:hypothetical protein